MRHAEKSHNPGGEKHGQPNGLSTFARELMRTGAMDIVLAESAEPVAGAGAPAALAQPEPTLLRLVDLVAESVVVTALLGELVLVLANGSAGLFRALLPVDR